MTREHIETAVKSKGYVWFNSNTDFDVNIVGIRNSVPGSKVTNVFDDRLTISYKENGVWKFYSWNITTDPGKKAVMECKNPIGCAVLVPGQYRSSHIIRLHAGKYTALGQDRPVKVYRDKTKDLKFEFDQKTIQEGLFGINIHHAGVDSTFVENWSEGCQVFKRLKDFKQFLEICQKARDIHGNKFSYTLLESKDIK
jgi:hypothetical protein